MSRSRTQVRRVVRDVLPVAVVAWMVFHGIRTELLERYLVPSISMEPTLHGDAEDGDVVLVDKTAWWESRRARPQRFDLVVVRNRWNPGGNHLVKRFIAEGPATVWIEAGDLFVREHGALDDPLVVKHPLEHPDLRQTSFEIRAPTPDEPDLDFLQAAPETWSVRDGAIVLGSRPASDLVAARSVPRDPGGDRWLSGHLSTAGSMDSSFLDARGRRASGGRVDVRDVGLELDIAAGSETTALHLVVELLEVRYAMEYSGDGRVVVRQDADPIGEPLTAPPLPAGGYRLAFGYLDGSLFVAVDDRLVVWRPLEVRWSSPREAVLPVTGGRYRRPPANLLHFGVVGAPVEITRIQGFHDVHYLPEQGDREVDGFVIGFGEIFVLGDNSYRSSDSRERGRDPLEITDLVGRPIAILAPMGRMRTL